jgi:hypothetical protein
LTIRLGSVLAAEAKAEPKKLKSDDEFIILYYTDLRNLAYVSRNPLLAVLAELHHLRFKAIDKTKPVALSNVALEALGFHRSDKVRSLKILEAAGMVTVQWRNGKSPLVTPRR